VAEVPVHNNPGISLARKLSVKLVVYVNHVFTQCVQFRAADAHVVPVVYSQVFVLIPLVSVAVALKSIVHL
jgi:hypothetical protein